jgi:hypothetical protein
VNSGWTSFRLGLMWAPRFLFQIGFFAAYRTGGANRTISGAPQARQVADRFHILQNLCEAIQAQLSRRAAGSSVRPLLPASSGDDEPMR